MWYSDRRVLNWIQDRPGSSVLKHVVFGWSSLTWKWDPLASGDCCAHQLGSCMSGVRELWLAARVVSISFYWHTATPLHLCIVYICFHSVTSGLSPCNRPYGPQSRKDLPALMDMKAFVKCEILLKRCEVWEVRNLLFITVQVLCVQRSDAAAAQDLFMPVLSFKFLSFEDVSDLGK